MRKLLFILLFLASQAFGANTCIVTTAPQDARVIVALGAFLQLGRNATGAEVKQALIDWLTRVVLEQERAAAAALQTPTPFTPN